MKKRSAILIILIVFLFYGCSTTGNRGKVINPNENPYDYNRILSIANKVIFVIDPGNIKNYRLGIIDDNGINAFTTMPQSDDQGKNIYSIIFLKGALGVFNDEELTFVTAHEAAHCKLNHVQKKGGASLAISAVFTVAGIFIPGANLLDYLVNPLVTNAYSRSQESDADELAVNALKLLGMTSEPAIRSFIILDNIALQKGIKDNERIGILDDHPSIQARIQKIKEMQ